MEKKTLQQLSQNQPFPHLYIIGSSHQIFQKRETKGTSSQDEVQVFALLPPFYSELKIVHFLLNFGAKALKGCKSGAVFFYNGYATLHAQSLKKCFISNLSFFQKLVSLSLRRHLQTLRYQRSSTKSRLKITSSRLL